MSLTERNSRRMLLVFVEGKARNISTMRRNPWRRISAGASPEAWLVTYPDESIKDIRFDAILVARRKFPRRIPAAFET